MKQRKKLLSLILGVVLVVGIMALATKHIEVSRVIEAGGVLAIGAIIFAETGLLIGFFLPGDTLLFAAGFFAAQGRLSLPITLVTIVLAAFFGNIAGYEIGKRNGKRIFSKEDSVFFHKKYIKSAEDFYKRHGGKTILFARFVPIIRTLAPLMAGTAKMKYRNFLIYNFLGALLWGVSITLIGYWAGKILGQYFNIDKYLFPAILLATILTFGGSFLHALREPETREALKKKITENYRALIGK
ncbi:MAG: DedA family protein [Candidatus Saccharimonadales bacterium]